MELTQPRAPRPLSVAATVVALIFALAWPPVLGTVAGIALSFAFDDWTWLKTGAILGVLAGVLFSAGTLAASYVINRVMPPPAPVAEAAPQQNIIQYMPLGSAPGDSIRIVPLKSYDKFIDGVKAKDIAWFCKGIARGRSHTQRAWLGKVAPSGMLVDPAYWRALSRPLRRAGIIQDVGPRRKGHVVSHSLDAMLSILGIQNEPDLWMVGDASEV